MKPLPTDIPLLRANDIFATFFAILAGICSQTRFGSACCAN